MAGERDSRSGAGVTDSASTDDRVIDAFIDALWAERGLSRNTLTAYASDLRQFAGWLQRKDRNLLSVERGQIRFRVNPIRRIDRHRRDAITVVEQISGELRAHAVVAAGLQERMARPAQRAAVLREQRTQDRFAAREHGFEHVGRVGRRANRKNSDPRPASTASKVKPAR